MHTRNPKSTTELPCSPISQILGTRLPVTNGNRNGGLQRELPMTSQVIPKWHGTVMVDSQFIKCNRFSYQQVIHILQLCKHQWYLTLQWAINEDIEEARPTSIPSQCSPIDRCIYNSVQDRPANPKIRGILEKDSISPFNLQWRSRVLRTTRTVFIIASCMAWSFRLFPSRYWIYSDNVINFAVSKCPFVSSLPSRYSLYSKHVITHCLAKTLVFFHLFSLNNYEGTHCTRSIS